MDNQSLKQLQNIETEILVVFDAFCKKHDLKYSLYAGTALGAVRHGGFIPWDDDIDVFMERAEYERFLSLWRESGVEGYYLQGTDDPKHQYIDHSKIRKNGTLLASEWEYENQTHNGIWLDVFPLDKVPLDSKKRKKYLTKNKFRMIYTRGYPLKNRGLIYYLITKFLLIGSRKSQLKKRNKLDAYIKSTMNMESGYNYMCLASVDELKVVFPKDMMNEITTVNFEGNSVSMIKDYQTMLTELYGDYMQLPPEEERVCKHNPAYLEFSGVGINTEK